MSPSEGFKIAVLREAADHAPTVLSGQLGATAREWLIGEANCHQGAREGGEAMQRVVNHISVNKTGKELPTELRMKFSTLDAAYDFAAAIISAAAILAARADSSETTR